MRPIMLALIAACGGGPTQLTTVSIGLTLDGEASAPTARLSVDKAIARRDELRADDPPVGIQAGERAWFFRAYDDDELVFLEGSYMPYNDSRPQKRVGRYHIDRRVVVPRTDRAVDALGVRLEIEQRGPGICGIRVGMHSADVHARLGDPTSVAYMQAAGCVAEQYGAITVQLCQDAVTHVSGERCTN
jgi:hypothetical protein